MSQSISLMARDTGISLLLHLLGAANRLDEVTVSYILQYCLGGSASDFRIEQLGDRVFKFQVSEKKVGFYIYNLKFYQCN